MLVVLRFALALTTLLCLSAAARADVVGPPPDSCPAGGNPSTCHGGPYCALAACTNDNECSGGQTCQSVGLCTTNIDCGGMGGPSETIHVLGACGASCTQGTCTTQQVCAPKTSTSGSGGSAGSGGGGGSGAGDDLVVTGCSCSLAGATESSEGAATWLLLAGVLGLSMRKFRRSSKASARR